MRGTISAELADPTTISVGDASHGLLKFHGTYEQYDRDTATELKQAGHDKEWQFMVRARIPAGRVTPEQYLVLDDLADRYGNGTLRITTRQTFQFHGVAKRNLRATIGEIENTLLTTMASCGDVVRNVVTTAAPIQDKVHQTLRDTANFLAWTLLPRSRAHHQIFVQGEDRGDEAEDEPLYGPTYLPRKFKIGLALPEDNTIDVLSNDLGLIAEVTGGEVTGWIACVGGGHGMTHNKPQTYPRVASALCRVDHADLLRLVEAIIKTQRDNGDRTNRKRARLKYVVDDCGLDWVKAQVEAHYGEPLEAPGPLPKLEVPEHLGWHEQGDGNWWLGLPISAGRIEDAGSSRLRTGLREAVKRFGVAPVLTPLQNILLSNVQPGQRAALETLLREHGVVFRDDLTPVARWSMACVALPTCGLALSEAERSRVPIVAGIEGLLRQHGLEQERISVRITGCPNGCARPYDGDLGIVGRAPGKYAIFVGGDFEGTRLNFLLYERIKEAEITERLAPIVAAWAEGRNPGEGFGDYCQRQGREALLALSAPQLAAAE
ncbi:MAG: NADPH-dependent assimilatory sulfite reductase hemoprotein subunit [Acetobacteraceae bacterium]|nr:NADPH-dependent assimilatory sulfite reductase hemoprotein subunit [Acetobacteraceae bacterium]